MYKIKMAEDGTDVYNQINECEGLESLFIKSLPKCEYKSDVVIVYAHHLLTQELDYEFAKIEVKPDENGEEKKIYNTMSSLPEHWQQNPRCYKLIYKNEKETRILTGQKNSRNFVLSFLQEDNETNIVKNTYSCNINLGNYIPNQFIKTNDISLIDNLSELRDILLKCFSMKDKIKAKQDHDKNLIENTFSCLYQVGPSKSAGKTNPTFINDPTDSCGPLRNDRGTASPAYLRQHQKNTDDIGKFVIQDKKKNLPTENNMIHLVTLNDPNYVEAEDPVGPPDEIYLT